jgi:ubiquinone/menaquinone biosynthesis C-methylase UbiE
LLSHQQARRVYDRIGALQDSQGFYEEPATRLLIRHGAFPSATAVFELGCGTGRFARRLLSEHLPADATYRAVDVSPKMVRLAEKRLEPWADRASVTLSEGDAPDADPPASCDRFVSNYVLELLPEEESRSMVRAARRMLRPEGLLCLTSLSTGIGPWSRAVARAWTWLQARRPSVVGGCKPVELLSFLPEGDWTIAFHQKVVAFGVTSEVVIARPRATA